MTDANQNQARASAGAGSPYAAPAAVTPVTRWSACLADPQIEEDYRQYRFADDRRRIQLLMGLVMVAGVLNFLIELDSYRRGLSDIVAVRPAFVTIWFPVLGLIVAHRLRSPRTLEILMLFAVTVGTITRLSMLTTHPALLTMWPAMMIGIVFVIYLYLPIRLAGAVVLAVGFSVVAPLWWQAALGDALPPDQFYRGLVWLLLSNALGYTAANSLHRSLRMQFAQSIVLRQLLSTDAMTGIANRRRFDAALEREWRRCQRNSQPLSLLMIDVDHFKAYNDHCGHPQGDTCLRQVAQLLADVVGRPADLAARYGGEEFVCLLPDVGSAGALDVANKLMMALYQADIDHPRSPAGPRLTFSIGAATVRHPFGQPERLVECADKLLYAAKAAGRNQVKVGQLTARHTPRAA